MSGNTNPEPTVAPDTDNLDDFEALFSGKAKPEETVETVEDNTPEQETQLDDDPVATEDSEAEQEEDNSEVDKGDDDPVEDTKPEPKKKPTAKDRIEELNAKYREEERLRIRAEERLKILEEQAAKSQPSSDEDATKPELALPNPDATDANGDPVYPLGDMDPAFVRDFTRASIAIERQAIREEALAEQRAAVQAAEERELQANWNTKVEAALEDIPDIMERGQKLAVEFEGLDPEYGAFLGRTLMELDNGPQVIAYLADNPSEARAIVAGGAHKAALSLGRIDARVAPAPVKTEASKKVTQAPNPPPITTRGNSARLSINADTDNLDDFEKLWNSKK